MGEATRSGGHCGDSGLRVSVSKFDDPFLAVEASATSGVVRRASLKLGPACRDPCAATSQICLLICEALLWPALTCFRTSGGTPQVALCSSRPFNILSSTERKALKSLHISSGGAFFWPARSEERRVGKESRSRWSPY